MAYHLRERRRKKHLTQQQLADKANVSRPTIYGIERGIHTNVKIKTLRKLAEALSCEVIDLL